MTLVRSAALVVLVTVALTIPAVACGATSTTGPPTSEPCAGCQPVQAPSDAGVVGATTTAQLQRENQGQADYVLWGLIMVLLVSVPVVVTWQRNVREKADLVPVRRTRPTRS